MAIAQDKGKGTRINGDITAKEVRLVGVENEPLGIVSLAEAFSQAEAIDIDLVEIAPNANPPVCRLMDYGKFKYAESKRMHEQKLKQKQVQIKEVKFRPATDVGDYAIKVRNITRFLEDGDKVKCTLRFRGREITHQEFGLDLLRRVQADLEEVAVVEQFPKMEGRQMVMVLSAVKKLPVKKAEKPKAGKATEDAEE
ncbi:MAG: translation initiation factor IF-3 [Betaproteobacteria bacterium]|jgi:translation initiation factor IF-3|nr:translation initiation factor IF-3 [Betaproteobacteria bacterium]MDG1096675.1 translation initiation factor IF-3 [Methylophilaceae bacterium]MDG1453309.1 translation initiation factor IF-3 [Methylophilaceae bacterium]